MQGRLVIVVANLKGKKMGGFKSEGMVMCASNEAHDDVRFIVPPSSAPIGSLVTFHGLQSSPQSSAQVVKKKILETCLPEFKVGMNGICMYKNIPFSIDGFGECTAPVDCGYSIS